MHQIRLNTIPLESNNLTIFTEKTMMASNHVVENTAPSITERKNYYPVINHPLLLLIN